MEVIESLKGMWRNSSVCIRLIVINVAIFALLISGQLIASLSNSHIIGTCISWLECPDSFRVLISRPWTLFTYMFVQIDFFHLLFNMLWLHMFGSVLMLTGPQRHILFLYIFGGIVGAIFFLIFSHGHIFFGYNSMVGSSASVMAIVVATAILHPDFQWSFILIGQISLKWVAIAVIILAVIGKGSYSAHIGGMLAGLMFALLLVKGHDISRMIYVFFHGVMTRRIESKNYNHPVSTQTANAELDIILDKVRQSGYASLTKSEKKRLIELSRTISR